LPDLADIPGSGEDQVESLNHDSDSLLKVLDDFLGTLEINQTHPEYISLPRSNILSILN